MTPSLTAARLLAAVAATALSAVLATGPARAEGNLTVYCSVQEEWCQLMVNEFQKATGITVAMTRKSSGETFAQVKAEAANPKGDVWWGGTGDPHLQAAEEGLTEAYESPKLAELNDWAVAQHKTAGGKSVGIYMGALGFGYSADVLKEKGVEGPKCWADLVKPEYKGEVQVANPASSGTAYTMIATLVQLMGEDKAFDYMKKLHANISQYTRSGTGPIKAVARGETTISISFVHDGPGEKAQGFPIETVTPADGTGAEIGSMSIIKGARNLDNAKKFYEFALTAEFQSLAKDVKSFQVPSNKAAKVSPKAPDLNKIKLIDYDFVKYGSAAERRRLLKKWDDEIGALAK